jgi:tetratricopeptide (TPR) repeat protein
MRLWLVMLPQALLVGAMAGCADFEHQRTVRRAVADYYMGAYPQAIARLGPLAGDPDANFVLNNVRLGSAALAFYDLDEAETAFLRAYEVLNSFGVNNGGRTLGAILVSESIKVWRGEPFEQAMAHFYLGLVYYMRQDYQNARAAFENALFKLRDYADEGSSNTKGDDRYREQESDFAVALVMLGKCWQRIGREDLARANFDRARQLRPALADLVDYRRNLESNVLLVVDYGYGPQKVTTFDGAIVGFAPKPPEAGPIHPPRIRVDGKAVDLGAAACPPVDLLALAQDRRWQSIDTIRAIKSAVGTGLIAAGAYQGMRRHGDGTAALILLGAGLLLKATSQADMRQWEMLPRTTFLIPLRVAPGNRDIVVEFGGHESYVQTWRGLPVGARGETTFYMRMARYLSGEYTWPPPPVAQSAP